MYVFIFITCFRLLETLIATFNESQSVTAPVVYLFNTGYPEVMNNVTSSITCTVATSCISSIIITAIDISFHDSTGCAQSLQVVDGDTVKTFTCDDNNEYNIRTIHNSSSHFIKLTFNSNVTVDAGKLWIQFNGKCLSLSLSFSICLSIYLYLSFSLYLCVCAHACVLSSHQIALPTYLFTYNYICMCPSLDLFISICLILKTKTSYLVARY